MPDHCRSRSTVTAPDNLLHCRSFSSRHYQSGFTVVDCRRCRIRGGALKLLAAVRFLPSSKVAWDSTCCAAGVEEAHERGQTALTVLQGSQKTPPRKVDAVIYRSEHRTDCAFA